MLAFAPVVTTPFPLTGGRAGDEGEIPGRSAIAGRPCCQHGYERVGANGGLTPLQRVMLWMLQCFQLNISIQVGGAPDVSVNFHPLLSQIVMGKTLSLLLTLYMRSLVIYYRCLGF